METYEEVRLHPALRAADAMQKPAGALVHEQARRDLDTQYRSRHALRVRQFEPFDQGINRRLDRIVDNLGDVLFGGVEPIQRDAHDIPRTVVDTEYKDAAVAVGERRELVGELLARRSLDPLAGEHDLLQLEIRALSEPDAPQQCFGRVKHGERPRGGDGTGVRTPVGRPP